LHPLFTFGRGPALFTRHLGGTAGSGGARSNGRRCKFLRSSVVFVAAVAFSVGCKCEKETAKPDVPPAASTATEPGATTPAPTSTTTPTTSFAPTPRSGSSIARSPDSKVLFVADEITSKLHVVSLPLGESSKVESVSLPGRPAQIVVADDLLWVTIRDPGMLWAAKFESGHVQNTGQVALPSDAWGVAITADHSHALTSSAWTSQVSWVDLQKLTVDWSHDVAREPRGIVIDENGQWALVSHLVGSALTKVELTKGALDGGGAVSRIALPASPLRAPHDGLNASLGYAGALSPDGKRYFAARHALGALGKNSWFGAATVDVLGLDDWSPLAPMRPEAPLEQKSELATQLISGADTRVPGSSLTPFVQPRAVLYRSTTQTLLVAGEGDDRVAELDAMALDPTMAVVGHYQVGADYHPTYHLAKHCAAPAGMALSSDENALWVYCGATNDLAQVQLMPPAASSAAAAPTGAATSAGTPAPTAPPSPSPPSSAPSTGPAVTPGVTARLLLAEDPLGPGGATGRKLFYNATDFATSGGLGCAGCHPEGRDDGHVWHEANFTTEDGDTVNFVGSEHTIPKEAHTRGYARRTPMLAGRVNAEGPYGWHAESPTIVDRELKGFALHRWGAIPETPKEELTKRARAVFDFLRRGLLAPARDGAALNPQQARGQELFLSKEVGCAECHDPTSGYTTRKAYPLPLRPLTDGFDEDPDARYKIPGLTFLAGRTPYFHDGSAATLEELVERNGTRMGNTGTLSADDRAALVAFLKTL